MNQNFIFFPCLGLMLLTSVVLLRMFFTRVNAVKTGSVDMKFFKTYDIEVKAPVLMTQAARNFTNLFEVPTLFYMLCGFALITQNVDMTFYIAAWLYVGIRCIHSYIHVTHNRIYPRMSAYAMSWLILMFMGLSLGYKILKAV